MNVKKKMLYSALFVMLILWAATRQSPLQILVNFVVAGSLPGFDIILSPYVMFGLALVGGSMLIAQFYLQNNSSDATLVAAPTEGQANQTNRRKKQSQGRKRAAAKASTIAAPRSRRAQDSKSSDHSKTGRAHSKTRG